MTDQERDDLLDLIESLAEAVQLAVAALLKQYPQRKKKPRVYPVER